MFYNPHDDATPDVPSLSPALVTAVLDTVASLASSFPASDGGNGTADEAENAMVVAEVATGAKLVEVLLAAAETVEESTAVAATSALNSLVGGLHGRLGDVEGTEGAVGSSVNATAAASSVGTAIRSLGARAVEEMTERVARLSAAASGGGGGPSALPPPLTIRSANLNLTLTVSEPGALGDEPFACDTASTPVEVALPPGMIRLLSAAGKGTEDEPVGVVFTVTSLRVEP